MANILTEMGTMECRPPSPLEQRAVGQASAVSVLQIHVPQHDL